MKRSGFTMIEVLLAVFLVGMILVAINTFVFSMGELWGRGTDVRLFDQHVRNVTRFLQTELDHAALPPAGRSGQSAIAPQEIKPENGGTEQLLTFELPEGCRLLSWPGRSLPDVVCSLAVRDREGLLLLWHSRLEKDFADHSPREMVITPLVTSMSYEYYDTDFKRWQTETALRTDAQGKTMAPGRLRLKFTYDKLVRETMVTLPNATEGLPQF
jgi:prepilin-type N-terminal cleavage/methylation domain-containing protein